jgi:hypothetical protein
MARFTALHGDRPLALWLPVVLPCTMDGVVI